MTELDTELMVQMHTLWLEYQDASSNLTVQECSNYLRLSDKTIYRRILDGKIEATRVGNKYIIPKKQFL
jgi:excisionase family DNA binding protein